jgi:hypothetical protein
MPDAAPLTIATLLAKRMACSSVSRISHFENYRATWHAAMGLATGR